jgi:PAS domain S-box-containing protein
MNRLVINPIMALAVATRQLADGQWRPTFRTSLPGEIGDLAHSFDAMALALAEREQLLQTQRDDLRDANAALRTSDERFHLVARATNDAIWDYDVVTQAVWWNDSVQSMFGYRAETIAPSFAWRLTRVHPGDQERVSARFAAALANGEQFWADEYRFRCSDGSYADVLDRAYVLYDTRQQPVRVIGSMMDMTTRKQVGRMKNEFIATVSHELRTPLTSIRGALGLIVGGVAGELPAQMRMMVEIAHKNSERLLRLINDILDSEKIESGTLIFDLQPQALTPLVEQAIEANRAYGAPFGVTFVLERTLPGSMVNVDGERLLQVFANLLSNAAKFSPPGGTVSIWVWRRDGAIRVAIRDHGPGVPTAFQARMFQKFAQADSSDTRQKGGTGLGLSIAKAIVEKLGGQIGFETASDVGTTFYIDLPEWHEQTVSAVVQPQLHNEQVL